MRLFDGAVHDGAGSQSFQNRFRLVTRGIYGWGDKRVILMATLLITLEGAAHQSCSASAEKSVPSTELVGFICSEKMFFLV